MIVSIEQLTRGFARGEPPAIDQLSWTLPKGKIVGIVGPDGAGKTTLIRLMAALLLPTSGTITIGGYDTTKDAPAIHEIIGYMPQKFGLYEDLTVMQNLTLYADLKGVVGNEREAEFERLLAFTGLRPFTDRLAGALSGGMKQKLGLACSLLKKPKLLLLDEPSVGVDPISRRELWKMVGALVSEGITVVWSTAYLDEAERCHSVLLLSEGKSLYSGPPDKLTERVAGRCYKLSNITGSRRALLEKILSLPGVLDGVIQGSDLRIVMRQNGAPIDAKFLQENGGGVLTATTPRFEDAFVDILGRTGGGESVLAATMPYIETAGHPLVIAKGLTRKFGNFTAASDITFEVKSGEIFGLLGPNGAGKSTTFKMLCGLLKPTKGEASVMGFDLQKAPSQARQQIGYMAQKFSLYGDLSTKQNLDFFSGIYHTDGNHSREIIQKMIEIFGLKPFLNVNSGTLPLGFKQRLALSCAVMHHPTVLFLDEPTSGVDPITRREFWTHINGLVERGRTVVVTTHFMDEAEYCDRIALVYNSKIIHIGTPDELKEIAGSPKNPAPTLEDAFIKLIEDYDREIHA